MPPTKRARKATSEAIQAPNVPAFLEVRTSTIPNAGMGLFARRSIPKGRVLGEYTGEKLTFAQAQGRDTSYMIYTDERGPAAGQEGTVIDGKTMENPMRWPNHNPSRENAFAEVDDKGHIFFRTKKAIAKGQEIFINYGEDYGL